MKKNNNKGFMMVELLVVAVVVLVIFTVLFANFIPTKGEYEKRLEYNDIDILYANYYMRVLMLRHFSNGIKKPPTLNNGYLKIVENETCKDNYNYTNKNGVNITCQDLVDKFGITDVVITRYKPTGYNGPLKEYINYLDIENGSEVYRITTKTTEGYSSSKFYSKICGDPTYGPWSKYTLEECNGDNDVCEKSLKKVKVYTSTSKPTNCDEDPLCKETTPGKYDQITFPCNEGCSCEGLTDCKTGVEQYLYRTRKKTIEEQQFEEQNFSVTPCN